MAPIVELDKSGRQNREIIKVVGVGGGGNNALNHIIKSGVKGVEFIAANTDQAHLDISEATHKIALGQELTRGLGAGSDPEIGMKAALESRDEIRAALEGADMVFIAAGMGGGTGTGASPIIANIAKETGTLVVAVVTRPFAFEGKRRYAYASEGIAKLKEQVDALIVIPNERLLITSDRRTSFNDAFKMADGVLHQAVHGVTELILDPGIVNVDFADVRTVMSNAGSAIMGIGEGYGENRVAAATHNAIHSPLMETPMAGAKRVLFNVAVGPNVGIHEIQQAGDIINNASDSDALTIWGYKFDPEMDEGVKITVIATGFIEASDAPKDVYKKEPSPVAQQARQEQTPSRPAPRPEQRREQEAKVQVPVQRVEVPEGDTRFTGPEGLFGGLKHDDFDTPAIGRRKNNK